MFKRKKKNNSTSYEDDIMNLASKEEEIMNSYEEYDEDEIVEEYEDTSFEEEPEEKNEKTEEDVIDDEEYSDFSEEETEYAEHKERKIKKIVNILFIVIMVGLVMIATDVICVARYNVGPFFAIPLNSYKDGGTKAYYGIGYKVIKYHQIQGRRDKEIGFWNLKYNVEPVTLQDIDLAIEMNGNEVKTYKKYYKKFVRVISTLESIDEKNNTITMSYKDDGGKYSLDIVCEMATDKKELKKLKEKKETTIIGTVTDFDYKTTKKPNKLYISNCFAEQ